ncbi:NAD(P)-binding oxidoreductase [Amycolatopsis sp. NPDC023774]|uniref:NAD(P)-dependent oxidoreductase n=1 Tax=Amycolatopsis sp. NPDC023774 TaxID=3155015 RepID=UPI0033C1EA89
MLRNAFADLRAMEAAIRASELQWTIVRPPRLTEGPATGRVRFSKHGALRGGFVISRADVATFLLDAAEDTALIGETVGIARG